MENIIYLLLFSYPGALVRILQREFVPQYVRHENERTELTLCRYFVYSLIITSITMLAYALLSGDKPNNFTELANSLANNWNIVGYSFLSLLATGLFTLVLFFVMKLSNMLHRETGRRSPWYDILVSPSMKRGVPKVVVIRKNNALLKAGVCYTHIIDREDQSTMSLLFADIVTRCVEIDEHNPDVNDLWLGICIGTYVNIREGCEISFYRAPKIFAYLDSLQFRSDGGANKPDGEAIVGKAEASQSSSVVNN